MKKYAYLAYDVVCVGVALLVALYLRHGFPLIQEGAPSDLYLLLAMTAGSALLILPLMRTHTSMWRFTSSSELLTLMIAVAMIILLTNSVLFTTSRLEMMPRSVPPMHWALAVVAMGGSRLLARRLFGPRAEHRHDFPLKQHVIVVGVGHTAELYLRFIKRIVQHHVVVEGFVDSDVALTGRVFQQHKILGTPEQLPHLLEQFHVHGIHVRQIVLTQLLEEIPREQRELLVEMRRAGLVELIHFGKHMSPRWQPEAKQKDSEYYKTVGAIARDDYEKPMGFYPYMKRLTDLFLGLALFVLLLPFLAITAILVALDVGLPLFFWQQRPGQYGRPFRLYKFRTMRSAGRKLNEDRLAHKAHDTARTSLIGKWLRRLRLDELPQILHIITGKMSFVGPRPLLPEDQPLAGEKRLSVRPGVTGWAQIHGGDALTPDEKLELDLWYIRHMSLLLDLRILASTLFVVFKEDRRRIVTP